MSTLGGWCMAAPGARVPHVGCTFALCSCECHRGSDPSKTRGFAVESGQQKTAPGGASTPNSQGLAELTRSSTDG
jgi:hypothetical protein